MELYKKYYKELNHNQNLKNRESYFNIPKISVIIKTVSELEQILTFVKNSLKIELYQDSSKIGTLEFNEFLLTVNSTETFTVVSLFCLPTTDITSVVFPKVYEIS